MSSTSFLLAGGVGVLANYALFSQYTPFSTERLLKDVSAVIQPLAAFAHFVLPALFGFLGGTSVLLVWNYLMCRIVRFLLEYDDVFLHPKRPINKLWFLLMNLFLGKRNRGLGKYQALLPSLPVPSLRKTVQKYLDSVRPLLTEEELQETEEAVRMFVQQEGKKIHWYLKFRSWRMRNWMADWWVEFIYLRQRTPICFNSNYYSLGQIRFPTHHQLDRAATLVHLHAKFSLMARDGAVDNAMSTPFAPFCSDSYKSVYCSTRVPGEEKDSIVAYHKEKPTHGVVYCKGRYYQIEVLSPSTGKPHSPLTIKQQLEEIVAMAPERRDDLAVQNLTSLPRAKWAKVRKVLSSNPTNRRSLHIVDSAFSLFVLDDSSPSEETLTAQADVMFHGDGYNHWFDKSLNFVVCSNGAFGGNGEHTALDATVCGQLWEFLFTYEKYDSDGRCLGMYPGETPAATPTPSQLKWELSEVEEDIRAATSNLSSMIQDSDLLVKTMGYGKAVPKKLKLSPDGWFQMAIQLAYYRLHHKFVLTYESATTRLFYQGRTETIRPVSQHSCTFVRSFDDQSVPREEVKGHLKKAIGYQQQYKMEAMRGMGVDRHLFGLYVVAKGMKLDPMPRLFTDKAFNFPFLLSTSQTPVKTTSCWTLETSNTMGGFGTVCEEGYGISYLVVGEDMVNFSVHCKRSCLETSSEKMAAGLYQAFEDMRALFLT